MGQLPEFKDSDEDELIALEGAIDLPQNKKSSEPSLIDDNEHNGDVQDFLKQLKAVEEDKDIDQTGQPRYFDQNQRDQNSQNISGMELDDFSDDGIGMGGHATNLDGLDKDQIMKMMDQEVDGIDFEDDGNNLDF